MVRFEVRFRNGVRFVLGLWLPLGLGFGSG